MATFDEARQRLASAFYDPRNSGWNTGHVDPESVKQLEGATSTFSNLFRQLVGRDPNETEVGQLYQQVYADPRKFGESFGQGTTNDWLRDFVGTNFQRAAEDQTKVELQNQQVEANRLADLFRTQGNTTAGTLEGQLSDFVQRTFEKVRPNLITSLQAQGLLNSGGLNQSLAGQAGDLTKNAQDIVADYRLQNEQQANEIAFGGASAPYQFQQMMAMNRIPNLQQQSQDAITRGFQSQMQQNAYQNQLGLLAAQRNATKSLQPSFLRTLGQSTAQSMGNSFGQWFTPDTAKKGASMLMGG
jgi:hypothetical protein